MARHGLLGRSAAAACALAACGALLAACALASCAPAPRAADATATRSFTSMDTAMTVTVHAPGQKAADDAAQACEQRVRELDAQLAPADGRSEIAALNEAKGAPTGLDDDVYSLIAAALDDARETEGAFDPTVYPLTSAWGFTDGRHRVPSPEELAALLPRVGFDQVGCDQEARSVTLAHGAQIDVGGIAKGFAGDELASLLHERGVTSALLDLGGNISVLGSKADGSAWKVGIADPAAPDQVIGSLSLSDANVSTSGAYQRFFVDDTGRRWHHILDPATGYPAQSDVASASVVGPDASRCDALSTALFVMGKDRALDLWREAGAQGRPFEAVLVSTDGTVLVTAGLADLFKAAEGSERPVEVVEK